MIFKIYEMDFGVTISGLNYAFEHVQSVQTEDPERTKLVRGANAGNKTGLVYKEGIKDPKTITVTIIGMSADLLQLLRDVYEAKSRLDFYGVMRSDGSSKIAKNAILSQEPKQLSLDDSPESMNVALVFESYDVSEVHKS
jgi:hypothetical protein